MTQIMRKKSNLELLVHVVILLSAICLIVYGSWWIANEGKQRQTEFKDIACPSLLSVGRSSRDTLIIMKVEPLCNAYVLENLK